MISQTFPIFLPATKLERLGKAMASGATAVFLDLEDAVDPAQKADARDGLAAGLHDLGDFPVFLRINSQETAWYRDDLNACASLPLAGIVLPKAEHGSACQEVAEVSGKPVIALIETALGIANIAEVAVGSQQLAFGSIDYASDLGIAHERHSLQHARSVIVHAARVAGQAAPLDGVTPDVTDPEPVRSDARYGREMGFGGKLLIHPAQVQAAKEGFAPTEAEVAWASRVLEASQGSGAAAKVDGAMIDAPVIKRAQSILARLGG